MNNSDRMTTDKREGTHWDDERAIGVNRRWKYISAHEHLPSSTYNTMYIPQPIPSVLTA